MDYVKDIWNINDIAKTLTMWVFIVHSLVGNGIKGHHLLASSLNFLLFVKIFHGLN